MDDFENRVLRWCRSTSHRCHYQGGENLLVRRLRAQGFNWEQICAILETVVDTCPDCWDADRGCQCQNDE